MPLFFYFFCFLFFFFSSARVTLLERTSELASSRGRPSNTYRQRSFHCDVDAFCHGNPTEGGGASAIIGRFYCFFSFFLPFFSLPCNTHTHTHEWINTQISYHSWIICNSVNIHCGGNYWMLNTIQTNIWMTTTCIEWDWISLCPLNFSSISLLCCVKKKTPTPTLPYHTHTLLIHLHLTLLNSWVHRHLLSPAALTRLLRADSRQPTSEPSASKSRSKRIFICETLPLFAL